MAQIEVNQAMCILGFYSHLINSIDFFFSINETEYNVDPVTVTRMNAFDVV